MAQLALTAVGYAIGGPFGAAVGSYIGATLFAPDIQGPRLQQVSPPNLEYGWPIPRIYGRSPFVECWRAWQGELQEIEVEQEAGKGGPTVTSYEYKVDVLLLVSALGPSELLRLRCNKELAYSVLAAGGEDNAANSQSGKWFDAIEFRDGNVDQLPWAPYEAAVGPENAIAYIGRCTIGIKGLNCPGGAVPLIEAEVVTAGEATHAASVMWTFTATDLGDIVPEPGSIQYDSDPQVVPIKRIVRYLYNDSGYAGSSYWPTLLAAIEYGEATAPGFIESTGEQLISAGDASLVSTVTSGGTVTESYIVSGVVRVLATEERLVESYGFTVQYPAPVTRFETTDAGAGRAIAASASFALLDAGGNQGVTNHGQSDEPWVSFIAGTSSIASRAGPPGTASADYQLAGSASSAAYARRGGFVYIGDPNEPDLSNAKVRKFAVGGGAPLATSAAYNIAVSGAAWRDIATDGVTVWAAAAGQIYPLDAGDLSQAGAPFGYPPSSGASPRIFCPSDGYLYCFTAQKLYRRDGANWTEVLNVTGSTFNEAAMTNPPGYENGTLYATQVATADAGYKAWVGLQAIKLVDPQGIALNEILTAEAEASGVPAALLDLAATAGITVDGYMTTWPARQAWEHMQTREFFDVVCEQKITTVLRGGASVVTIPYERLGVGVGQPKDEPLEVDRDSGVEVPARFALTYYHVDDDSANGTVHDDRHVNDNEETRTISLPTLLTQARAQGIVDTIADDARVSTTRLKFAISDYYANLRLADVLTVTGWDGTLYRARLVRESAADGVREFEAALDDAGVLRRLGIASGIWQPSVVVGTPGAADLVVLDTQLLREADNEPGLLFAIDLRGGATQAAVYESADDVQFSQLFMAQQDAVVGTTVDRLKAWTRGHVWDRHGTLDVKLTGGTLSSSTEAAMRADLSINTFAVGAPGRWEIIRARSVTALGNDTWRLSTILRGFLQSERHTDAHLEGDRFVVLRPAGLRSQAMSGGVVGLTRYYRAVVPGRSVNSAASEEAIVESVRARPVSPVRLRCARDTANNATLSCSPRTRLFPRWGGTTGSYVPEDEPIQRYEWRIYGDEAFVILLATYETTAPELPFSAAQQTALGLAPGDPVTARVAKVNSTVGRGDVLEGTV